MTDRPDASEPIDPIDPIDTAELVLPADATSVAHARRFVRSTLEGWSLGRDRVDDASLAVSELVTNALLHAGSPVSVGLDLCDGSVRVRVGDHSPVSPEPAPMDPIAGSGRGLWIVDAVAQRWGSEPHPPGKVVWFELATNERTSQGGSTPPG